jgi:hypothetical protein
MRAAIAAALVAAALVAIPATADAATPDRKCVDRAELRQVRPGMTTAAVYDVLDGRGSLSYAGNSSGYRYATRTWRTCTPYGSAFVSFSADPGAPLTVDGKGASW